MRNVMVTIKVTKAERKRLIETAQEKSKTVSAYLRLLVERDSPGVFIDGPIEPIRRR